MQIAPSASPRPHATAGAPAVTPSHAAEDSGDGGGESFASLLGAPAEPAAPTHAAPPRDRARAAPNKLPAQGRANAGSPSADETRAARQGRAEGTDDVATPDGAALHDWLASLMHLPVAPEQTPERASASASGSANADVGPSADTPVANAASSHLSASGMPAADADPTVAGQLLAAGQAPAGRTTGPTRAHADSSSTEAPGATAATAHPSASHGRDGGTTDAYDLRTTAKESPSAALTLREPGAEQAALFASASKAEGRLAAAQPVAPEGSAPPPFALPTALGTPPPQDSAPLAMAMPVPLEDPRFAQALGVQVSLLARDGVHEAELHLNPADMGPVSVQIVLEGTQARVEFGADMARTRELIEHSLPELAAALRDAGLTLSGGSVSQQQARGGEDRQAASDSRAAHTGSERASLTGGTDTAATAAPARRWVRSGGVDLYA